jgi:hypothetical protein
MGQVFISYKGDQESWAARVADTLQSFGVDVWRDHGAGNGIRVGQQWRPELEAAIRQSTDMVVLWSEALMRDATSVAHQEINFMQQLVRERGSGRFIPILLDDAPVDRYWPLAPYQGEISLKPLFAKGGSAGADTIGDPEWYGAMLRLLELFDIRDVVEVRYLVAAMSRAQAVELLTKPEEWAQDLAAYKSILALREKTVPFDADQYGAAPDDWRPFPHLPELAEQTIADLIFDYDFAKRQHILNTGNKPKWVLVSYSSRMLSSDPETRRNAREAMAGKCLVVVDPLSLLHRAVFQHLVNSWGLQARDDAFVIGLAPCEYQMHADFRQTMPAVSKQMKILLDTAYDKFAQPFAADDQCVLEVGHHHQFARWLQVAADGIVAAGRSPLRFGAMNPAFRRKVRTSAPASPGSGVVVMGGATR